MRARIKARLSRCRAQSWDAMDRLHAKGYISDPKSKAKSVVLTQEGCNARGSCSRSTSGDEGRTTRVVGCEWLQRHLHPRPEQVVAI